MKWNILALVAALVLGAFALTGCNQKTDQGTTDTTTDTQSSSVNTTTPAPEPTPPADQAEPVAFTNDKGEIVCPVMGTVIEDPSKAVGYQDYEGKRYYFCCDGCPAQFKADPEKYKNGKPAEGDKTSDAGSGSGH